MQQRQQMQHQHQHQHQHQQYQEPEMGGEAARLAFKKGSSSSSSSSSGMSGGLGSSSSLSDLHDPFHDWEVGDRYVLKRLLGSGSYGEVGGCLPLPSFLPSSVRSFA